MKTLYDAAVLLQKAVNRCKRGTALPLQIDNLRTKINVTLSFEGNISGVHEQAMHMAQCTT